MNQTTIQEVYDELIRLRDKGEVSMEEVMTFIDTAASYFGYPCIDSDQAEDNFVMTFKRGGL